MVLVTFLVALACASRSSHVSARSFPTVVQPNTDATATFEQLKGSITKTYFSNEELDRFIVGMVGACSDIMTAFEFGRSALGTRLLAVDISSNAGTRDGKPYFHWLANMHGNEPSGRQLTLATALYMCEHRDADTVRATLERMHVIIVPTLNPDGFAATPSRREDSKGRDLNRGFPDRSTSANMTGAADQPPEIAAVMALATALPATAGCNMHEGALVANFPWDGDRSVPSGYAASPDDATFVHLATMFANLHETMSDQKGPPPGFKGIADTFDGGITNGNAWYPVFGGMQDWLYVAAHTLELTLELSEHKFPKGDALDAVWRNSRRALLEYPLFAAFSGIRGEVLTDGGAAAEVLFTAGGLPFPTTAPFGTFARAAPPGRHTVRFAVEGVAPVERTVEVPPDGGGVEMRVDLRAAISDVVNASAPPAVPFPFPVIAGRAGGVDDGQAEAVSESAEAARAEEARSVARAAAQRKAREEQAAIEESYRHETGLFEAGRWALFVGGVVWVGYKVAVYRAGKWPGQRAAAKRTAAVMDARVTA